MSGLNVGHFMKTSTVQIITKDGLAALGPTIMTIAKAEGLHAHADSVMIRGKKKE
jgi:histidinol dehydrogenase